MGSILAVVIVASIFMGFQFMQYRDELVRVFYGQFRIATFQGWEDRPIRTLLERQSFDREMDGLITNVNDREYEISGEHTGKELRDFTCYVYQKDDQLVLFSPAKARCAVLSEQDAAALQALLAPENLDKRAIG